MGYESDHGIYYCIMHDLLHFAIPFGVCSCSPPPLSLVSDTVTTLGVGNALVSLRHVMQVVATRDRMHYSRRAYPPIALKRELRNRQGHSEQTAQLLNLLTAYDDERGCAIAIQTCMRANGLLTSARPLDMFQNV